MTPERWQAIKRLHAEVQELPPEERLAFLEKACGDDRELYDEVRELVFTSVEDDFLKAPSPSSSTRREVPDMQGRVLGDFVLEECIGQGGGGGAVYRAVQRSLGRAVAIKILPPLATLVPRHLERFKREAGSAARIAHEGIVPIHAFGEDQGVFYYAMELVEGGDLATELRKLREGEAATIPSPRTLEGTRVIARLVAEVADAIQYAHDRQIVHRDIKPQNLVLGANGRLQLVDFGLARDENLGTLTFSGEIRGTPHYMSPEQARISKVRVDHRTDIYSLGVVLYEMLTLHRPFEGRTSEEILESISHTEARRVRDLNEAVPIDLETICHKAMEKDLARRYPTARELAEDLRRFLASQPIEARPPSVTYRLRRFARREQRPLGMLAAAALALVVGVAGYAWWSGRSSRASWPEIDVSVDRSRLPAAAADLPAEVFVRRLETLEPTLGPAEPLGRAPLDGLRLAPGYYRFEVRIAGQASAELSRDVTSGTGHLELVALLRPDAEVTRGMVRIPAGSVTFAGSDEFGCPHDGASAEIPAFWIDEAEVSFREFRAFLADTGREPPARWKAWPAQRAGDDLPAVGVGWDDMVAYAEWAGKRLVTHAEWERAGSGAEGRDLPWIVDPDDPGAIRGNANGDGASLSGATVEAFEQFLANAAPVRSSPEARTPEGLYHMFGNVNELTESPWITRIADELRVDTTSRAALGGSWRILQNKGRFRDHGFVGVGNDFARHTLGFRCAKSVQP